MVECRGAEVGLAIVAGLSHRPAEAGGAPAGPVPRRGGG